MDVLKTSPSPEQIEYCIKTTPTSSDVERLRLVSALLKYTVPEAFLALPESCKSAIAGVFRSTIGLGNLIARISMISRSKADFSRDISTALDAHMQLLDRVLYPGLVSALLQDSTVVVRREVDKLLFKGRVYAIVREAAAISGDIHVPLVLRDMAAYMAYLASELLTVQDPAPLTVSLLSLGESFAFFDIMFTRENGSALRSTMQQMKRFERKQLLVKSLDYAVHRYMGKSKGDISDEVPAALAVLNRYFLDNSVWDDLLLEKVVSRYSYALNTMVAMSVSGPSSLCRKFIGAWGSDSVIKNEPLAKQSYRTHLLLSLCAQLPAPELQDMLKSAEFVSAVTSRLSSLSNQVKFLGVFFADKICVMAAAPPIFDMGDLREMQSLGIPEEYTKSSDFSLSVEDAWEVLEAPQIIEAGGDTANSLDLNALSLQNDTNQVAQKGRNTADDAYMSDEEDDPTMVNPDKVSAPIYVRDLLTYLSADPKDKNAYEKRRLALYATPTLLRQKSGFGTEVSFYASDILAQLVALTNHYEEAGFETARLNALIAVVVSHPDVTPQLCKLLLTGDYSLSQRLSLLSAMSFGARALRGYRDDIVDTSFKKVDFPTQMLPKALHDQYAAAEATDYGYSRIENSIQNDLMREPAESARDELGGGKVLRVSAKLRKQPPASEVSKDLNPHFRDIVGKNFFFPLVAVWYESGGINIGHYTPVLIAHYVRTLSLVLHCAYPAARDLREMAGEYLTLVTPLLQKVATDQLQVIESVVTGVMLICETLDETYLVTYFDGYLHIIESVISSWWDSLIDERVKSLCAGLLLKMHTIKQNMERTILDQMNGSFYA